MEKILIPAAFVGGFLVGKNWNKIAKVSGPYVKKSQDALKDVVAFAGIQGKKISQAVSGIPALCKKDKPAPAKAAAKKKKVVVKPAPAPVAA